MEATNAGFGLINYITECKSDNQRAYVYKYLTKGIRHPKSEYTLWELRLRRWSASAHPPLYPVSRKSYSIIGKTWGADYSDRTVSAVAAVLLSQGGILAGNKPHTPGGFTIDIHGFPHADIKLILDFSYLKINDSFSNNIR